jgi:NAD(P)-dependent dehydrogenase (short-subunit alcohol dehydrogenase family)
MSIPTVLITGGAKRIGAQMARAFGAAGWHVIIHYGHSREDAEGLAATLPSAETVPCDLADGDAAVAMVQRLSERHQNLRLLINSAAVFRYDGGEAIDPAIFAEAMQVNAQTPARMAQAFLKGATHGRMVINMLDMKLANPNPDFFSYTMAKHALSATVRMLAMAYPAHRVYGLAPGAMMPSWDQQPDEHLTSGRMNLLQRLTDPAELADAALFMGDGVLASGETLFIDSGQFLLSQPRDVLYLARA